jgi:hypothetical protein
MMCIRYRKERSKSHFYFIKANKKQQGKISHDFILNELNIQLKLKPKMYGRVERA